MLQVALLQSDRSRSTPVFSKRDDLVVIDLVGDVSLASSGLGHFVVLPINTSLLSTGFEESVLRYRFSGSVSSVYTFQTEIYVEYLWFAAYH